MFKKLSTAPPAVKSLDKRPVSA